MTTSLWQGADVIAALGGQCERDPGPLSGVSIDSRTCEPGDLFVALSGKPPAGFSGGSDNALDGHDFVEAAAEAGAAAAVVSRRVPVDIPQILVADTFHALWDLGRAARSRLDASARVVAVTGSAGKTTFRGWLHSLLAHFGSAHASTGSLNNHWGVPLSMARMPATTQFAVFEVGTNRPGEIAPLSALVSPHVAVLLNVLPAHIGNFPDMAALREEKLAITAGLVEGGRFVVNHTLLPLPASLSRDEYLTFGTAAGADVTGIGAAGQLQVTTPAADFDCVLPPGFGDHHAETLMAALATLTVLDLDPVAISGDIASLALQRGRGERLAVSGVTVVDDSYNANPVSVKHALESLSRHRGGRKIALLGEMLELGADAGAMHASLVPAMAEMDAVYTFGAGFDGIAANVTGFRRHYMSTADFDLAAFVASLEPGDCVLIKGGNRVFWVNGFVASLVDALRASGPGQLLTT